MDDVTRYSQCIATHADQRSASSERIWLRTVAVTLRDTHPPALPAARCCWSFVKIERFYERDYSASVRDG